jgi:beta-galactosidase/beta-glucuronidase
MENIQDAIRTLTDVQQFLGAVEELRKVLLGLPMEAITEALSAIRKGWRLEYGNEVYRSGDDYDDVSGGETWCLTGPSLAKGKYWQGQWDHRSREDNLDIGDVLDTADMGSVRMNKKFGKEMVEALQVLSAIFPKGGDA